MTWREIGRLGQFGLIGSIAFLFDTAILYSAMALLGTGLYSSKVISYLGAATFTWYFNRRWTFSDRPDSNWLRQWGAFLLANAIGGLVNYAAYAAALFALEQCRTYPVLAVAIGSIAGLVFNYTLSARWIFTRARASETC